MSRNNLERIVDTGLTGSFGQTLDFCSRRIYKERIYSPYIEIISLFESTHGDSYGMMIRFENLAVIPK